jgi:hypothetical protein
MVVDALLAAALCKTDSSEQSLQQSGTDNEAQTSVEADDGQSAVGVLGLYRAAHPLARFLLLAAPLSSPSPGQRAAIGQTALRAPNAHGEGRIAAGMRLWWETALQQPHGRAGFSGFSAAGQTPLAMLHLSGPVPTYLACRHIPPPHVLHRQPLPA